jgi:hypothetical protein
LVLGVHRGTGQRVLIAGDGDPIAGEVEPLATLGFVESYPANPRGGPHAELPYGVVGLVRVVDRHARRHVYGIGSVPDGDLAGELGALEDEPRSGDVPVWIDEKGRVVTDRYSPPSPDPSLKNLARWVLAPLGWRGFAGLDVRGRAAAMRARDVMFKLLRSDGAAPPAGPPAGYLSAESDGARTPIFSAIHPVTGDQLLTPYPLEAADMGYGPGVLLGFALALAPLTGQLGPERVTIPWASRFGHNARRA